MNNRDLRRNALRAQMQTQRQLLANQLIADEHNHHYPRSMIMRFLTHQSGTKVIAEVATVFLGARILKSLTSVLAVAKLLQSVAGKRNRSSS